jgi:hypothetical protein
MPFKEVIQTQTDSALAASSLSKDSLVFKMPYQSRSRLHTGLVMDFTTAFLLMPL